MMADRSWLRSEASRALLPFSAAVLSLILIASAARADATLPSALATRIADAAVEGRTTEATVAASDEPSASHGNRRLNAVAIELIADHPELVQPIVEAALTADPEGRDALVASVAEAFPGFTAEIALAQPAPTLGEAEGEQVELTFSLGLLPEPELLPIDKRPPTWPILPEEGGADGYADIDPLWPINLAIFYVNGTLDWILFEPIAEIYSAVMWDPAEEAVGRAFDNLGEPLTFVNDLLQLEFTKAGIALGRFLINSTFGIAGLFDVAKTMNLPRHKADFGQTLYRYGIGDGIYIVLPLFGPSTLRDAAGFGVDFVIDPRRLVYFYRGDVALGLAIGEGVVRRAEVYDEAKFIELYAEHPYDAVRAWTWQQRSRFLAGACEEPTTIVCSGAVGGK